MPTFRGKMVCVFFFRSCGNFLAITGGTPARRPRSPLLVLKKGVFVFGCPPHLLLLPSSFQPRFFSHCFFAPFFLFFLLVLQQVPGGVPQRLRGVGAVCGAGRVRRGDGAVKGRIRAGHPPAGPGHAGDPLEGVHRLRGAWAVRRDAGREPGEVNEGKMGV